MADWLSQMNAVTEEIINGLQKPVWSTLIFHPEKPLIVNDIYVVTTIRFGMIEKILQKELCLISSFPPKRPQQQKRQIIARSVGWFRTKADAVECINGNLGDIYECGTFPYVVIEQVATGLYPMCEKSWWFRWREGKYRQSRKPASYKRIFNFAIG